MLIEDVRLLDERQRTLLISQATAGNASFMFASVTPPPVPGGNEKWPKWILCTQWVYITDEEPRPYKNLPYCKGDVSSLAHHLASEGDTIFLILLRKQLCPQPWQDISSKSSKAVAMQKSF